MQFLLGWDDNKHRAGISDAKQSTVAMEDKLKLTWSASVLKPKDGEPRELKRTSNFPELGWLDVLWCIKSNAGKKR